MPRVEFVGVWRLQSMEVHSRDGKSTYPFGEDASGYICYTKEGFMSVSIMRRERGQYSSNDYLGGTIDERAAAAHGYLSYCGPYETTEDRVIHHVEMSLFPNWIGQDLVRFYRFDGDRLFLTTDPFVIDGNEQIARLVWRRKQT